MTPETISETRPVRIVPKRGKPNVLYHEAGRDLLLSCDNDRGRYEVLVTSDRVERLAGLLLSDTDLSLTGFWRRRSGWRKDGTRHFVWTLVLLDASRETACA